MKTWTNDQVGYPPNGGGGGRGCEYSWNNDRILIILIFYSCIRCFRQEPPDRRNAWWCLHHLPVHPLLRCARSRELYELPISGSQPRDPEHFRHNEEQECCELSVQYSSALYQHWAVRHRHHLRQWHSCQRLPLWQCCEPNWLQLHRTAMRWW